MARVIGIGNQDYETIRQKGSAFCGKKVLIGGDSADVRETE